MIEGLRPYSEYKESGLPWLGKVPSHWVTKRGKSYMTAIDRRSVAGKEELLTVSSARGVIPRKMAKVTMFKAESYTGYKLCWPGDLVINSLWAWAGGLGVSQNHGIISTAYSVYRPRPSAQMNARFLHELVRSSSFKWELHVRSKGIWISRLQLTENSFLDAPIPLPPPDEQAAIVRFLGHANRKIDSFIRAKRKLIRLLDEQKQVIIHRAVTRGLHQDVPLKRSGVLWVNEVPEHWSMTPNRSLFRIRKVLVGSRHKDYQVLSLTKRGVILRDMSAGGKFSNHWERSQEVRPNDLVFCFFDVDETPRAVGLSPSFGMISPDYTVMECPDPLVASFLEKFYVAMDDRKMLRPLYTGLRKRISKPLFLAAKTPIPPLDEMLAILAFIKDAVVGIDKSLNVIQREIALLQEYLKRLTADIVTGKLDVREAAAKLPDWRDAGAPETMSDEALEEELETEEIS